MEPMASTIEENEEELKIPTFIIYLKNQEFYPKQIRIPEFSKVFFKVSGDTEKNINSLYYNTTRSNIISFEELGIESGYLKCDETFGIAFIRPGIYNFRSLIYPWMKGIIDVYSDDSSNQPESARTSVSDIDEIAILVDKFDDILQKKYREKKQKENKDIRLEKEGFFFSEKKEDKMNFSKISEKIKKRNFDNSNIKSDQSITKIVLRSLEPARGKEIQEYKELEIIIDNKKATSKHKTHQKKKNKKKHKKGIENLISKILNFEEHNQLLLSCSLSIVNESKLNLLEKYSCI